MKSFWDINGFIIIENFYSHNECDKLRKRTKELVKKFVSLGGNVLGSGTKNEKLDLLKKRIGGNILKFWTYPRMKVKVWELEI